MTNHLHMIVDTSGTASIGDVLRDFKKFTSKGIVKAIQENEQESRQEWLMNRFQFRAANDKKITPVRSDLQLCSGGLQIRPN